MDKEIARKLVIPDDPRNPKDKAGNYWEAKADVPYRTKDNAYVALSPADLLVKAKVAPTDTSGISYKKAELTALKAARRPDVEHYFLTVATTKRSKLPPVKTVLENVKKGSPIQLVKDVCTHVMAQDQPELDKLKAFAGQINAAYVAAQEGNYCLITPDGSSRQLSGAQAKIVLTALQKHEKKGKKAAEKVG